MKKILALAVLAVSSVFALAACGDDEKKSEKKNPTLDDVKVELTTDANGTKLKFTQISGGKFDVYRASSRFGDYELVESGITDGEYSDNTHKSYYKVNLVDGGGAGIVIKSFEASEDLNIFGENCYILSPDDDAATVKTLLNNMYVKMKGAEFSQRRFAALLKPGEYDSSITFDMGYYMTVSGLGEDPSDVSIGALRCKNRDDLPDKASGLVNFWRTAENLSVRSPVTWAISQGASLRAIDVNGNLSLHDAGGATSGGFISDSKIIGAAISGSQQQWLSRNCTWNSWSGNLWNMCFAGVTNPPRGEYPTLKYTIEEKTSVREKPYLVYSDTDGYRIAVPPVRENAVGCYRGTDRAERYIATDDIYFARADRDGADDINTAIAAGKNIVFTPGIYKLDKPIAVEKDNTILLGLGLATLTPLTGKECLIVKDCENVTVSGLLMDAGAQKSDCLASIGTASSETTGVALYDCFFRVGGAADNSTAADTCLKFYADNGYCENIWLWRADHGSGVAWNMNKCDYGAQFYGDNIRAYGLMSEHFQKHNVLWHGNGGKVFFYQSEIAYDIPTQSVWMDGDRKGYASFKVADEVDTFEASGLGVYTHFLNKGISLDSAMLVPDKPGICVKHIVTVQLSANGSTAHVINDFGTGVSSQISSTGGISTVTQYPEP